MRWFREPCTVCGATYGHTEGWDGCRVGAMLAKARWHENLRAIAWWYEFPTCMIISADLHDGSIWVEFDSTKWRIYPETLEPEIYAEACHVLGRLPS